MLFLELAMAAPASYGMWATQRDHGPGDKLSEVNAKTNDNYLRTMHKRIGMTLAVSDLTIDDFLMNHTYTHPLTHASLQEEELQLTKDMVALLHAQYLHSQVAETVVPNTLR